eukprot:6950984-Alexandrium_andersonii.AAC.1
MRAAAVRGMLVHWGGRPCRQDRQVGMRGAARCALARDAPCAYGHAGHVQHGRAYTTRSPAHEVALGG